MRTRSRTRASAPTFVRLPDVTIQRAMTSGGPLVCVDLSLTCRQMRDTATDLFGPAEMERVRIEALCAAMAQAPGVLSVQMKACETLDKRLFGMSVSADVAGDAARQRKRRIAQAAGALTLIAGALRAHGDVPYDNDSRFVAYLACRMLRRMAILSSRARDARALNHELAQAGAIESAVAAIDAHGSCEPLCAEACPLLHIIPDTHETRRRAEQAGAIEAAVATLNAHRGPADVQYNAAWVLQAVLQYDEVHGAPEPCRRALACGAVEALCTTLREHGDDQTVAAQVARSLFCMSDLRYTDIYDESQQWSLAEEVCRRALLGGADLNLATLIQMEAEDEEETEPIGERTRQRLVVGHTIWLEHMVQAGS